MSLFGDERPEDPRDWDWHDYMSYVNRQVDLILDDWDGDPEESPHDAIEWLMRDHWVGEPATLPAAIVTLSDVDPDDPEYSIPWHYGFNFDPEADRWTAPVERMADACLRDDIRRRLDDRLDDE